MLLLIEASCFVLPEEVRQLTQIKLQVLRTGKGVRIELKTTSRAGTCTHDLTVEPLRDSADTIVWGDSMPGQGSTSWFTIPTAE